jgi:hypothetical protein
MVRVIAALKVRPRFVGISVELKRDGTNPERRRDSSEDRN